MRFVPMKSIEQRAELSLHRVRHGFIEERTSTLNRLRGLLAEFGHVLPLRAIEVRRRVPELRVREMVSKFNERYKSLKIRYCRAMRIPLPPTNNRPTNPQYP
jgi:transposase